MPEIPRVIALPPPPPPPAPYPVTRLVPERPFIDYVPVAESRHGLFPPRALGAAGIGPGALTAIGGIALIALAWWISRSKP